MLAWELLMSSHGGFAGAEQDLLFLARSLAGMALAVWRLS